MKIWRYETAATSEIPSDELLRLAIRTVRASLQFRVLDLRILNGRRSDLWLSIDRSDKAYCPINIRAGRVLGSLPGGSDVRMQPCPRQVLILPNFVLGTCKFNIIYGKTT